MFDKLISKIRKLLKIDEDMTYMNNSILRCQMQINENLKKINENTERIDINRETLKNISEVSTDVHQSGHSWAVISVGGNLQYVKFVNLNGKDVKEIASFLKRYEASRHTIDTPYSHMFSQELFYFKGEKDG